MITHEFEQGQAIIVGASKNEVIGHVRKFSMVEIPEIKSKVKVRPDGRWQYKIPRTKKDR